MLDLLAQSPVLFGIILFSLVVSISVHEFAHAWVSFKLGDPTAKYLGRITLNPRAHIDPMGMLFLMLVGIGWGRPVPFNPLNLKNPKRDSALIALAGPASNFVMAFLAAVLIKILPAENFVSLILYLLVYYNLALGVFNLMPFHPLDGFKIVGGILPNKLALQWYQMQTYGLILLLVFLVTDSFHKIVVPIVDFLTKILGLAG